MEQPSFSIIVPTYARIEPLAACLQALAHLDYPRDRFEVIVVDDGSPLPPQAVVAAFRDRFDVTLLQQAHAGPAAARNAGAARAKGEFLGFTDDDCTPAPDWLRALAARLSQSPNHAVGGRTLNVLSKNLYATASQQLVAYLYEYYNTEASGARFFTSNNLALPTGLFHTIGRFDTTYVRPGAEDREFCDRWLYHGCRLSYAPEAIVYHAHALTLRTFWRQHVNYGRGALHYHQVRARRGQERVAVEPLSFYLHLLRYPYSQAPGRQAWTLASLLLVSQVANAIGYLWERVRPAVEQRPNDQQDVRSFESRGR